jgi:Tol biopolymer transport system component
MHRSLLTSPHASRRLILVVVLISAVFVSSPPSAQAGSPSNGRIVFQRVFWDAHGHTLRIALFTIEPDGSDLQQLTDPPAGVETGRPDWSPNGLSIAYMRTNLDEPRRPHIVRISADGSRREDLTKGHCPKVRCQGESDPAWSPDGGRLAFVRVVHDVPSIFVMRSDGTRRRRVMPAPTGRFVDSAPAWSPQGDRLVLARYDQRYENAALVVVRLDDAHAERITAWNPHGGSHPDWSPDGGSILFQEPTIGSETQLFTVRPDGTGLTQITNVRGFAWMWGGFSPDGTMMTAVRELGETSENDVYVMNLDGTGIQPVTASLSNRPAEGLPDWGQAR